MGFVLFTETGTFDPKTYGLKAGDVLHVKVVGGGGGGGRGNSGASDSYTGGAGLASSFGDVLAAAGGLPGGAFATQTFVQGSNAGGQGGNSTYLGLSYYYGGTGGDGWMPNYYGISGIPPFLLLPHCITGSSAEGISFGPLMPQNKSYTYANREFSYSASETSYGGIGVANALPYGHAGSVIGGSTTAKSLSAGGVGYGAGGGTALSAHTRYSYAWGGSSGVIADTNYVLSDTREISVTVGTGGAGYKESSAVVGGGGANGCVAIWW